MGAAFNNILMVTYCTYIVMLEYRHKVWPYEYMTFSRRIGELWEPFCKLCFEHSNNENLTLIRPPLFNEVKNQLKEEIDSFIFTLSISKEEKKILIEYYEKVWSLITSGQVKLELDLHFKFNGENINLDFANKNFNIDFKSGFHSNEKGNTNRLLLVGAIYKNIIHEDNKCIIFVRSDQNNHYLETIKNSGLWNVFCAEETYNQINNFTNFNLMQWITENVDWISDLSYDIRKDFEKSNLLQYLNW